VAHGSLSSSVLLEVGVISGCCPSKDEIAWGYKHRGLSGVESSFSTLMNYGHKNKDSTPFFT
jgi:hypothetical protein